MKTRRAERLIIPFFNYVHEFLCEKIAAGKLSLNPGDINLHLLFDIVYRVDEEIEYIYNKKHPVYTCLEDEDFINILNMWITLQKNLPSNTSG